MRFILNLCKVSSINLFILYNKFIRIKGFCMQNTLERKTIENIDFNCDLAQSFGIYKNILEFNLLDYVSSVNISCGFHAGDPLAIKNALLAAKEKNTVIGAHIGFDDIQGFGYRNMDLTDDETEAIVIYQVGALMSFAKSFNLEIEHVRPHGAMYKKASEDFAFSCAVAKAVKKCSKWLVYYGAAGDVLSAVGEYVNIPVAHEVFLDKVYNTDGTVDYSSVDIKDTETSISHLKLLLSQSQVYNNDGGKTIINADTIHFTNRNLNSSELVKRANEIISPLPVNYKNVYDSGWVE